MQVVTMPTNPKLATSGMAQKIMVLRKQSDMKDSFKEAKLSHEKNEQTLKARKQEFFAQSQMIYKIEKGGNCYKCMLYCWLFASIKMNIIEC